MGEQSKLLYETLAMLMRNVITLILLSSIDICIVFIQSILNFLFPKLTSYDDNSRVDHFERVK